MLTAKKQELLSLIYSEASYAINMELSNIPGGMASPRAAIEMAIAKGIQAAFETFLDKTYSNEEFELDLGLKDV